MIGTGSIAEDHIAAFKEIGEVEFDTAVIFKDDKLENQNGILCKMSKNPVVLQDSEFFNAVKEKRQGIINAWTVLPTMRILQKVEKLVLQAKV